MGDLEISKPRDFEILLFILYSCLSGGEAGDRYAERDMLRVCVAPQRTRKETTGMLEGNRVGEVVLFDDRMAFGIMDDD